MNVLILSCGTRNKIIQYMKKELAREGMVIATDMSPNAPALYEADKYYLVPRMTEPGYLEVILDICRKEKIDGVFSLIDPELSLLAEHEERFGELGVRVIGSSYELCARGRWISGRCISGCQIPWISLRQKLCGSRMPFSRMWIRDSSPIRYL